MLPFFRKIRFRLAQDNKFLQYSRYAIGEIVLVVIGILIALYINNWNEERIKRQKEVIYLTEIKKNLVKDTIQINNLLDVEGIDIISNLELRTKLSDYYNSDYEKGTQEVIKSRTRDFTDYAGY